MTASTGAPLRGEEAGFTVIELLVVVVVIPLIIGAIASAMVVAFNTESHNSNRISDSLNVQLTQDYFVRDTLGASYVTTYDNGASSGPFSSLAPQVCSPGTGSLLVALYRPASGGGVALDVAYWLENAGAGEAGLAPGTQAEVDRYSCSLAADNRSTSPVKTRMASIPPTLSIGTTQETITASADIRPVQFYGAAGLGWAPVGAFTTASGLSGSGPGAILDVGTSAGFNLGTTPAGSPCVASTKLTSASGCTGGSLTVETTAGPEQLVCNGFTLGTASATATFTCDGSSLQYPVTSNSLVTQSNVSAIQIAVSEPASGYHFSLSGAPRSSSGELASRNQAPTLLTLSAAGINPGNGGGGHKCVDHVDANICVGSSGTAGVVVDAGGTVFCNGGGGHTYIHFQNNDGTVETVAPASSSSCNTVAVAPSSGVPDPLKDHLPNGGCLLDSYVTSLPTNPRSSYNSSYSAPGVWNAPLSGTLEPGLYIVEAGIGNITGMAPYADSDSYYSGDHTAGILLYIPPTSASKYPPAQNCYTVSSATTPDLGRSVAGLSPLDATQSQALYQLQGSQPSSSLAGVWLWQDMTNSASISTTGYTQGGALYAPGAQFSFSGNGTISTGSMVVAGVNWNGTDGICLNWPSSGSWNDC